MKVTVIHADITEMKVDAIVNAANTSLLGGGGVDGAIHKKAGPTLLEECIKIRNRQGGCKTGEAVITGAGQLKANFVIHTVGPVWNGGANNEAEVLKSCYTAVLDLCIKHTIKTVAFPAISTGIYKFPKVMAANIALDTIKNYENQSQIEEVIFVCYDKENKMIYDRQLKN